MEKAVTVITSCGDERDECKRTVDDASKYLLMTSKPESHSCSGKSMAGTYLLTIRCPAYRRRDSHSGFRTELETLAGDVKEKGTSGDPVRLKVPMRQLGSDYPIVVMKQGNACGAKGVGHPRQNQYGSTGNRRSSLILTEGGSLHWVARAG